MNLVDVYLVCLIVGFTLATLSVGLGLFHVDLPRHFGHVPGSHFHLGASGHHPGVSADGGSDVPVANFSTLMVFLAWFGGAGVLLSRSLHVGAWLSLPLATGSGVLGAYLVYIFVARVLMAEDHTMRIAEYRLPGTLATVTASIGEGQTGAVGYVQGGARKGVAARTRDGSSLPIGLEVIVTHFEEGIAYVRPFDGVRAHRT